MILRPSVRMFGVHILICLIVSGCATSANHTIPKTYSQNLSDIPIRQFSVDPDISADLNKLDKMRLTRRDLSEVLSSYPAPRIFGIGGGVYTAHILMEDLAEFLTGMGYPAESVYHPDDGKFAVSSYSDPEKIAGETLFYYQYEGVRPVYIGHSLGGVQAIKTAHFFSGNFGHKKVKIFDPIAGRYSNQKDFVSPLSGEHVSFSSLKPIAHLIAVGSGGISRVFPSQWSMGERVKQVPDSVLRMTGIHLEGDWLGNDFLTGKEQNEYQSLGSARVENFYLPPGHNHVTLIRTKHLLEHPEVREWIDSYNPHTFTAIPEGLPGNTDNILLAAELWHILKEEWYLAALEIDAACRRQPDGGSDD
ncbi:MAG: hypothetical protein KC649_05375 [Candidatus Omnitrophica bacterium]|nr:hypothetical protein [Candidatus Omnitrophota bacterium]